MQTTRRSLQQEWTGSLKNTDMTLFSQNLECEETYPLFFFYCHQQLKRKEIELKSMKEITDDVTAPEEESNNVFFSY